MAKSTEKNDQVVSGEKQEEVVPEEKEAVSGGKPVEKAYTKAEMEAAVEKARKEEKDKVYSKLEGLKADKEKTESKIKELELNLNSAREDLDSVRSGQSTESEAIVKELKDLRGKNSKLEDAIEHVASDAAAKLIERDLKLYREKRIRETGCGLPEMVHGKSEEEIEASLKAAMKREEQLRKDAEEKVRKAITADIPAPISSGGSPGAFKGGYDGPLSPTKRQEIATLPKDEYLKRRNQLMADARKAAGIE
jgi:cell division septum initiation protein DivIVA